MAETDALSNFDFNKVAPPSIWLRFQADKPVTMRVLTVDPVITNKEFTDKKTGEVTPRMQLSFIVYNFTEGKAQILQASPAMARRIGDLHNDEDFGANIRNVDLKITPTGEGLDRRYEIQVLPQARQMNNDQIKEAQAIDLDKQVGGHRMSQWEEMQNKKPADPSERQDDVVIEDIGDEPINLDDIPF